MQSIAVLLNANARLVTDKVRHALERIIPRTSLFLSHTTEEARDYVKHIIDNKFNVIFSGGGDGSFVNLINLVRDYVSKPDAMEAANAQPKFGILKLGTGNGISNFVGSYGGTKLLERVLRAKSLETIDMGLIERNNRIFHYAGSGFDARIAGDYQQFMNSITVPALRKQFSGLAGYFCSGLGKTVPESVFNPDRGEVRIEVEGDSLAYQVEHRHGIDTPVETQNRLLYSGPSTAVAVATEPYYGYDVRAFPFANLKEGYMNLRVLIAKPVSVVANMRQYWDGSYRGKDLLDFLVKKIRITYEKATPLHVGGDFENSVSSIVYQMHPQTCKLIDFRKFALA